MIKKPTTGSGRKRKEQDVCGTSGTIKEDKFNHEEGKNEGTVVDSRNSAEDSGWKITAASTPQN